jgi:hypothetical protein
MKIISPSNTLAYVGLTHGSKEEIPAKIKQIASKHGAWYEGDGGDKLPGIEYRGSWDELASKEVKGYPKEFLYTLFTNSNENDQKHILTSPDKTIFDSALGAQGKWGYFKGRKFDANTLKEFLKSAGMLEDSGRPATKQNVEKFIDKGEALMWPKNWEEYPNPAGKLAQLANGYRDKWLRSRTDGVYFVGSDHIKSLGKSAEIKMPEEYSKGSWKLI